MSTLKNNKQAYFVGGGLASLASATYLIRDCGYEGKDIQLLEGDIFIVTSGCMTDNA